MSKEIRARDLWNGFACLEDDDVFWPTEGVDAPVLAVVTGLNLLGFPTRDSSGGSKIPYGAGGRTPYPHVGIYYDFGEEVYKGEMEARNGVLAKWEITSDEF